MNSKSFNFSNPLITLCWGVLPGNKSLVIVSSGLSGNQTSRAQMETRFASGSHNSFPSTLIPDLKEPIVLEFSLDHLSINSLTSFASREGFMTYMSSLPWPTLWYKLIGLQDASLSLRHTCGCKFRICRFSIIALPSSITLIIKLSLSSSSSWSSFLDWSNIPELTALWSSLWGKFAKIWPIWGYTECMALRWSKADMPPVLSSLSLVMRIASSLSRCRLKSQKHAFLLNPPSTSRLNPLMPKSAESPCPPGKT